MPDMILVIAAIGTGIIAGRYLGIVGFLLIVVVPSLIVLVFVVALARDVPLWIVPLSWIGQQAAYLAMLWLTRPKTYRVVVDRVRLILRW